MNKLYLSTLVMCILASGAVAQKNLTSAASFIYGGAFYPEDTIIYRYHTATGYDTELETWNADSVTYFTVSPAMVNGYEVNTYNNNKVAIRTNIFFAGASVFTMRTWYFYTPGGKVDYYTTSSNVGNTFDSTRVTYTYNGQGNITGWVKLRWDIPTSQLHNDSRMTYNYSGTLLQNNLQELWDGGSMQWVSTFRTSYLYVGGKLQSQVSEQNTSSGWENSQRSDFTYDANGYQNSQKFYLWYPATPGWGVNNYVVDTNSSTGLLINSTIYVPNSSGYDPSTRTEYTYNTDKQMTRSMEFTWDAGNIVFVHANGDEEWHYHYGETVGIKDRQVTQQAHVMVYPVPAAHTLFVDVTATSGKMMKMTIYDISGKVVKNISINDVARTLHSVDVSDLPAGNYTLRVEVGESTTMHHINIQ